MKLFLVRHGADEEGFRGGWSSRGLVEEGIVQAARLAEFMKRHADEYGINTIVSSDLVRAVETCRPIEQALGIKAVYTEEWREMNNGLLAGMPHQEAEEKYPGLYFNTLHMDTAFPGGETPAAFCSRIRRAFDNLCARLEEGSLQQNVAVVTHGGVINVLYYYLSGQEWTNKSPFFRINHTSVHTVERTGNGWALTERNRIGHLEDETN